MDRRDQRPPRSVPPRGATAPQIQYPDQHYEQQQQQRPSIQQNSASSRGNVSFQSTERGDRTAPLDKTFSYQQNPLPPTPSDVSFAEEGFEAKVARKKSLVRPDREKIEPGHRQWYYRNHAAQLEDEGTGRVGLLPSSTGNVPRGGLRRGKSLLARDEDVPESGLALFKRGATLRRRRSQQGGPNPSENAGQSRKSGGCLGDIGPGPKDAWMIYCYILTIWAPSFLLNSCGIRTPEQQRAWREKMGLLSVILTLMAGVGFLTFGFTQAVCGKPPMRFQTGKVGNGSVIIHGYDYDFTKFKHPAAGNTFNGQTNPLLEGNWGLAGNDASFLFQKVAGHCKGYFSAANNASIPTANGDLQWYFPCNIYNQFGTSGVNLTGYDASTNCHTQAVARNGFAALKPQGQVYYTWKDIKGGGNRNLAVFESVVLDFNLLKWLNKAEVNYPPLFDELKVANGTYSGRDITMQFYRSGKKSIGHCLQDLVTVGFIDTKTIGCVASDVVLWLSLVFIIGVVAIRFGMAVVFGWFISWRLGAFKNETYEQRMQRAAEIENWTDDIYRPAPGRYRPNVQKNGHMKGGKKGFLPNTSRFTPSDAHTKAGGAGAARPVTTYGNIDSLSYANKRMTTGSMYATSAKPTKLTPPEKAGAFRNSRSSTSLESSQKGSPDESTCPFPLRGVIPQPPADYQPFNYPLAHTICLVTAYSESAQGLRTTLDSLATTDYPNSHKLIMVIADGMVKGAGNTMTTPDIVLSMMKELVVPIDDVEPHSYVAIADGHKRHNMAKVYAGFYDYDDATVEMSKQQRVPIVLVAKCGNPLETTDSKPGNRGKRDSQIVLMAFLQKVMFDERMTTFEYEFFNSIWRVTGVSPDRYEMVLCVDADTKVFPDSITRMVACMVHDEEIMGLCGETKIANKAETWVTMIQVFEYYISHHLTKAFESMFGGVTCLPGCFSMYRIKAPKGGSGYWVPILANPDIVEHYSENVVDTLHKKNLLLLGEDRYLSTLMLKTFPKRKMIFCPQAVCKTVVPDTFKVLLSQRRRWINSTVHNLAELLFVRDLCGTFCFSMQFVVFMELAGTLVLPAAISFTIYLIVISIIPHHANTTIPLILLGIILGLPGLLIVVTSRKVAYLGWMLIYLMSLPVWNFVLPTYAFWHFDDFSWGQTRRVTGDKGGHTGDKEGQFDSTHIVMKRWAEFERERRWKSGTQSRDSTYYDARSGSPKREGTTRYSLVSSDNAPGFDPSYVDAANYNNQPRPRYDSAPLLMLPAPLSVNRGATPTHSANASSTLISRSSEDSPLIPESHSRQRLIPSPSAEFQNDGYNRDSFVTSPASSPSEFNHHPVSIESYVTRAATATGPGTPVLRQGTLSNAHPGETPNPYRHSQPQVAGYDEDYGDDESVSSTMVAQTNRSSRGVSLADNGPVPGPEGVRRVARPSSRRPTSQQAPNRYSRSSMYGSGASSPIQLPPGAAPPTLPPGAAPPRPAGYPDYS
ncbi:glycosyltransferase family 2 protein [Rickenella mellea]|uniref:chitin synthase n=1 Tax=Rickenella mellea TaxID=50990 RepID=A0A4Y7Q0W3_9AGAM|nr:glycosyltransferase family 2 protein [Rickenella mellea]